MPLTKCLSEDVPSSQSCLGLFLMQTSRIVQINKQLTFAYQTRVTLTLFWQTKQKPGPRPCGYTLVRCRCNAPVLASADMLGGSNGSHEHSHVPQQQQHFHPRHPPFPFVTLPSRSKSLFTSSIFPPPFKTPPLRARPLKLCRPLLPLLLFLPTFPHPPPATHI